MEEAFVSVMERQQERLVMEKVLDLAMGQTVVLLVGLPGAIDTIDVTVLGNLCQTHVCAKGGVEIVNMDPATPQDLSFVSLRF